MRTLIAGGPRTGKTTLANELAAGLGISARHTDDLIWRASWGEDSVQVAKWLEAAGPWVIEGVTVPRALRKWLDAHPEGAPADLVVWLSTPRVALTHGQKAMSKAIATVWSEVTGPLVARGVTLEVR